MKEFRYPSRSSLVSARPYFPLITKSIFTLFILLVLYFEIFYRRDLSELYIMIKPTLQNPKIGIISAVLLLMPVNWFLESRKWQIVVSKFSELSSLDAYKMIMVGLTFGIITPSRVGEYAGRFYMMRSGKKWHSLAATFVGSLAQNIVTGGMGVLAIFYLLAIDSSLERYIYHSLIWIVVVLVFFGLFVYYQVVSIAKVTNKFIDFSWIRKIAAYSNYLQNLSLADLNVIIVYSTIRYTIYTLQYCLLLFFFGIELPLLETVAIISLLFLIQSGLPLPPLLGVLARGELAIAIWSLYTGNTLGIVATTLSLWIINLVIPAISGLGIMLAKKG